MIVLSKNLETLHYSKYNQHQKRLNLITNGEQIGAYGIDKNYVKLKETLRQTKQRIHEFHDAKKKEQIHRNNQILLDRLLDIS